MDRKELTKEARDAIEIWFWKSRAKKVLQAGYKDIDISIPTSISITERGNIQRERRYQLYQDLTNYSRINGLEIKKPYNEVDCSRWDKAYVDMLWRMWELKRIAITHKWLKKKWLKPVIPEIKKIETKWTMWLTNDPKKCAEVFLNNSRDFNTCQSHGNVKSYAKWWHNILTTQWNPLLLYYDVTGKLCMRSTCKIVKDGLEHTDKPSIYIDMCYIKSSLWARFNDDLKLEIIKPLLDLGFKIYVYMWSYEWSVSNKAFLSMAWDMPKGYQKSRAKQQYDIYTNYCFPNGYLKTDWYCPYKDSLYDYWIIWMDTTNKNFPTTIDKDSWYTIAKHSFKTPPNTFIYEKLTDVSSQKNLEGTENTTGEKS